MWITLFFIFLSVSLPIEAQELTSFATQSDTENPYTNYAINWDSTRPPVTLTIRDGRTNKINRTVEEKTDQPLYYSNEWQGLLLPVGYGNNAGQISYQNENESSMDHQFVPTFLRRPDSEPTNSAQSKSAAQNEERNQFLPAQLPITPVFFYPDHTSFYDINNESQLDNKQNISSPEPRAVSSTESIKAISDEIESEVSRRTFQLPQDNSNFFDFYRNNQRFMPLLNIFNPTASSQSVFDYNQSTETNRKKTTSTQPKNISSEPFTSITKKNAEETAETEKVPQVPDAFQPVNFYRNFPGFIPPMAPLFYSPYPFLPFGREGVVPPALPYPNNDPNFDREVGPGVITDEQENPERQVVSADGSESVPIETPGIPPAPLPLPVAGFPFGVLPPPPYLPPLIPSAPIPTGVPLNRLPLPNPINVQKESVASNPIVPPPVAPVNSAPENIPPVLPKVEYVEPNGDVIPETPITPEEELSVEQPTVVKLPYEFGFNMNDGKGNGQHRKEVSDGTGSVTGSYGYRDVFGVYRVVNYIADKDGFRAFVQSNEPGVASSGSADVVVRAERPPPHAVAEGVKANVPETVVVSGESTDLSAIGSSTDKK